MASNSTSISHFISTAKDLDDLQYIDNYFTSHSITPQSLEKNVLCDLLRLYDCVFNTPVPSMDHPKAFLGFIKCLQQFSFETDDAQWQPEHENFMGLMNKSMNYINAHFEKGDLFNDSFDAILDIIINISKYHQTLKTKMLQTLSPIIFDIIIKNTLSLDLLKKCLTALTNLVTRSELVKRKEVMELVYPKLCRFFDQLYACGDFDTQLCIVETLLRYIVPDKNRKLFFFHFKQKDPELIKNFLNIRSRDFDVDCRLFLNYINKCQEESALVLSIPCLTVLLDDIRIEKPPEQELFWIDFNKGSQSISIWCSKNSLLTADEQKITEYACATDWQSIVLYPDIVSEVSVNSSMSQSSQQHSFKEVIFFLKGNIIIRPLSNIKCSKSKLIHIIFPKSQETEDLDSKILPQLFPMKKSNNDELLNQQDSSVVVCTRSREKSRHVSEVKTTISFDLQSKLPTDDTNHRNGDDRRCMDNEVQIKKRRKVSKVKTTIEFQSCVEQISSHGSKGSMYTKSNLPLPAGSWHSNRDILTKTRDRNDKDSEPLLKENITHYNSSKRDDTVSRERNYKSKIQQDLPEKSKLSSKELKNKFPDRLNRRIKISESIDKCSLNLSNNSSIVMNRECSNNLINKENENLEYQKDSLVEVDKNLTPEAIKKNVCSNLNKISNIDDITIDDKNSCQLPNESQVIKSKRGSDRRTSSGKKNKYIADKLLKEISCNTNNDNKLRETIHYRTEIVTNNSEQKLVSDLKQIPENNLNSLGVGVLNISDNTENNVSNACQVLNKASLSNVDTENNELMVMDGKSRSNNRRKRIGHNSTDKNILLEPVGNVGTYPENNRIVNEVNEYGNSNPTTLGTHDNVQFHQKSIQHSTILSKNLVTLASSDVEENCHAEKEIQGGHDKTFSHEIAFKNQIQDKRSENIARGVETQQKRNHSLANDTLKKSQISKCLQPTVNFETMSEEVEKRYLRRPNKSRKIPLDIISKKYENNKTDSKYESKENIDNDCLKNYNNEEIVPVKTNTDLEQNKDPLPVKYNKRTKTLNSKPKNCDNGEGQQNLGSNEEETIPILRRSNRKKTNDVKVNKKDKKTKVRVNVSKERESLCPEKKLENEILISSNGKAVVQCETKVEKEKNMKVNGNDEKEDHNTSPEPFEILTEKTKRDKVAKPVNLECSTEKEPKKLHDSKEMIEEGKHYSSKAATNVGSLCDFGANQKDITKQNLGGFKCAVQQEAIENISDVVEQRFSNQIENMDNNAFNLVKTLVGNEHVNSFLNDKADHLKSTEYNKENSTDSKCSGSMPALEGTSLSKNINKNNEGNIEKIVESTFVDKHNTSDIACKKQDGRNDTNSKMATNLNDKVKNTIEKENFSTKKNELCPNNFFDSALHPVTKAIVHANPDVSVPSSGEQPTNNNVSAVITTSVQVYKYFSQSVMSVEKTVGKKCKSNQDCNTHKTKKTNIGDKNKRVSEETHGTKVETVKTFSNTPDSVNDFKSLGNFYISNKKRRTKSSDKMTGSKKKQKKNSKEDASNQFFNKTLEKNVNNEPLSSTRNLRKRKAVSYVFDSPKNDLSPDVLEKEKYSTKEKATTNIEEKPRKLSVKRKLFTHNQVDIISLCSASQSSTTTINYQEPTNPKEREKLLNETHSKPLDEFDMVLASSLPPLPKKFNRWEEKYRRDKESLMQADHSKSEVSKLNKRKHSVYSDLESDSDSSFLFFKTPSHVVTNTKAASPITPSENNNNDEIVENERVVKSGTISPVSHGRCSPTENLMSAHPSPSPDNTALFLNVEIEKNDANEKHVITTGEKIVRDEKLMINTNDISVDKVQDMSSDKNDCELIVMQTLAAKVTQSNNVNKKSLTENLEHKSEKRSTKHKTSTPQDIEYSNNDAISDEIGKPMNRITRIDHAEKRSELIFDSSNGCRREEQCCTEIDGRENQTVFQIRKLQNTLPPPKQIRINNDEDNLKDSRSNTKYVVTEENACSQEEDNNKKLLQNCDAEVALDLYESSINNQNNECCLHDDRNSPYTSEDCIIKELGNGTKHFKNKETIKYVSVCENYEVNKANKNKRDAHAKDNIMKNKMKMHKSIEKHHRKSECFNFKDFEDDFHLNSSSKIDLNMCIQSSELAENCSSFISNNEHNLEDKLHNEIFRNSKDIVSSQINHHAEQNISVSSSQRRARVNRKMGVSVKNTKKVISNVKQTIQQTQSQRSGTFDSDGKLICSSSVSSSESSENLEDPVASSEEECTGEIQPYMPGSTSLKEQFQKMVYEKTKYINAFSSHASNALLTQLSNSSSLFVKERTSYIKTLDDIFLSNIMDIQTQLQYLEEYEQFLEQKKAEMIAMINRQKRNSEVMVKSQLNIQQAYESFVSDSRFKQHFDIQQLLSSMKESYMKKTLRDMLQKCRGIFDMSP